MTAVFAVFRRGIHSSACGGIFSDQQAAIDLAEAMAAEDIDSWHHYDVVPFTLNERVPTDYGSKRSSPFLDEAEPVYTCEHEKRTT